MMGEKVLSLFDHRTGWAPISIALLGLRTRFILLGSTSLPGRYLLTLPTYLPP